MRGSFPAATDPFVDPTFTESVPLPSTLRSAPTLTTPTAFVVASGSDALVMNPASFVNSEVFVGIAGVPLRSLYFPDVATVAKDGVLLKSEYDPEWATVANPRLVRAVAAEFRSERLLATFRSPAATL